MQHDSTNLATTKLATRNPRHRMSETSYPESSGSYTRFMPTYKITFGNIRKFNASFYDTICLGCNEVIEEGDPCGYITDPSRHSQTPTDLYCHTCLETHGTHATIEVTS